MDKPDESPAVVSGNGALLWDCGSSLYDSFELTSFRRQLDAAITSGSGRCFSMPHLSESRLPATTTTALASDQFRKKQSRLSKSMQKLIRSVFRLKPAAGSRLRRQTSSKHSEGDVYSSYSDLGGLGSIPEVCEKDLISPESNPTVRRTASLRFAAPTVAMAALAAVA